MKYKQSNLTAQKQKYPLLIPPTHIFARFNLMRKHLLEGYPLYKDYLFKPLHAGQLKAFKHFAYLKDILHKRPGNNCYILDYLNKEEPLDYRFLSGNISFDRDWQGKTKLFTKVGRSEAQLQKALNRKNIRVIAQYNCTDFLYALDFAYINPELKVKINIEIDEDHHFSEEHLQKDKFRNYFLAQRGWGIIRFTERQILDAPDICAQLVKHLICTGKIEAQLWDTLNQLEYSSNFSQSHPEVPQINQTKSKFWTSFLPQKLKAQLAGK